MSSNRVFFPNLNSVRFLAALVVIIHHMEMTKYWFGLPNIYTNSFVGGVFGQLGIISFFVLSGFLITYLLLEEYRRVGTISVKSFYMRRILRIWPVYYLIVVFSMFISPQVPFLDVPGYSEYVNTNLLPNALLHLSFLPNVGYTLFKHLPYAAQTWSVGVEEQFYLIWPLLMLWGLKKKKVLHVLIGVIVVYLAIKTTAIVLYGGNVQHITAMKNWLFWDHFSIDCMAIGGIGAYLLFYKKEKLLKLLFSSYLQYAIYITLAVVTVKGWQLPWYNKEWYAMLFIVVILNLAANKRSVVKLEFRPLSYLGKISYGLYMYHNLVLTVVLKLILMYDIMDVGSIAGGIAYQVIALSLTIVLSAISYEYFEKWFLSLKGRFVKVQSGDELKTATTVSRKERIEKVRIPSAQTA